MQFASGYPNQHCRLGAVSRRLHRGQLGASPLSEACSDAAKPALLSSAPLSVDAAEEGRRDGAQLSLSLRWRRIFVGARLGADRQVSIGDNARDLLLKRDPRRKLELQNLGAAIVGGHCKQ